MYLHSNKATFASFIDETSRYYGINFSLVEKDYYVFMTLKLIVEKCGSEAVFKGGTSLSKAYGIIQRFSEDIDLCLPPDKIKTDGARKRLTTAITNSMDELGLTPCSTRRIERRGIYNDIRGSYESVSVKSFVEPYIKVETAHRIKEYPFENRLISSYVSDYLASCSHGELIKQCGLEPFYVATVSMYRTFIDKLFAIADYYLAGKNYKYSRHLYDLYKIINVINWNDIILVDNLRQLLEQVRLERINSKTCLSVQGNVPLKTLINEVLTSDFFMNDYNKVTGPILFDNITYEMCKITILNLINSSIIM